MSDATTAPRYSRQMPLTTILGTGAQLNRIDDSHNPILGKRKPELEEATEHALHDLWISKRGSTICDIGYATIALDRETRSDPTFEVRISRESRFVAATKYGEFAAHDILNNFRGQASRNG